MRTKVQTRVRLSRVDCRVDQLFLLFLFYSFSSTSPSPQNSFPRDLSTIVNEQGEALDRVEVNIDTTADQTGKAVDDLRDANAYDKAYRNKLCCCALCVAIAVAIVVFIVIIK